MPRLSAVLPAAAAFLLAFAAADVHAVSEGEARREIESIERAVEFARERERRLEAERRAYEKELAALNRQMVEAARKVQDKEAAVTTSEDKLAALVRQADDAREDLARRRGQLAGTLAALQRLAQRPPEALLTMPADPVDTVRTAILLGAVVPPLEREAASLRGELARLADLRRETRDERDRLTAALQDLRRERAALAELAGRKELLRDRAAAERRDLATRLEGMAQEAKDLRDLIARLEAERRAEEEQQRKAEEERRRKAAEERRQRAADAAARRGKAAERPREVARGPEIAALAEPEPPRRARTGPEVRPDGGSAAPAQGRILRRYGEGSGARSQGVTFETRQNAQVVAPRAGRVAYAGPFRGYGLLLIIAHGDGYHSLLTGFSRIDVAAGQRVVAGEPVGVMGTADREKPELYMELRHNGQPVNPMPWLAAQRG